MIFKRVAVVLLPFSIAFPISAHTNEKDADASIRTPDAQMVVFKDCSSNIIPLTQNEQGDILLPQAPCFADTAPYVPEHQSTASSGTNPEEKNTTPSSLEHPNSVSSQQTIVSQGMYFLVKFITDTATHGIFGLVKDTLQGEHNPHSHDVMKMVEKRMNPRILDLKANPYAFHVKTVVLFAVLTGLQAIFGFDNIYFHLVLEAFEHTNISNALKPLKPIRERHAFLYYGGMFVIYVGGQYMLTTYWPNEAHYEHAH